jgi:hypothetical protein
MVPSISYPSGYKKENKGEMRERRELRLPAWYNPQTHNDCYAIINPCYWTDLIVKS